MKAGRLCVALLATGALAAAGCGSDDDEGGGGSSAGGGSTSESSSGGGNGGATAGGGGKGQTVKVSATEFKFSPANPKVKAGNVTFEMANDGQAPHAIEIEGPNGEKESPTVQGGETAKVSIDLSKPGSYTLYCPVGNHRQMGMEGKVNVSG